MVENISLARSLCCAPLCVVSDRFLSTYRVRGHRGESGFRGIGKIDAWDFQFNSHIPLYLSPLPTLRRGIVSRRISSYFTVAHSAARLLIASLAVDLRSK